VLVARYLAVQGSRWVIRDVEHRDTELLFWMLPRGLVTAVLALEIVNDRGQVFGFLPAMAFTVVLVTNLFIVWGAVRAGRTVAPPEQVAGVLEPPATVPEPLAKAASVGETTT